MAARRADIPRQHSPQQEMLLRAQIEVLESKTDGLAQAVGTFGHRLRPTAFISYARQDTKRGDFEVKRVRDTLVEQGYNVYLDIETRPGVDWERYLTEMLEGALVAVPLVSDAYFGSEYIARREAPAMKRRLRKGELTILPVLLSPCEYESSWLGKIQFVNPAQPLKPLIETGRSEDFMRVLHRLGDAARTRVETYVAPGMHS